MLTPRNHAKLMALVGCLAWVSGCGSYYGKEESPGTVPSISPNRPPNATLEVTTQSCPTLDFAIVAPTALRVGDGALLLARAQDPELRPLAYTWVTTGGEIADLTAPWTTFTCTEAGIFHVFVTVTNGLCDTFSGSFTVECKLGDPPASDVQ